MHIGPIKCDKEEERIIVKSWISGILVGVPLAVITAIFFNLIQRGIPQYPFGVFASIMPFFICLVTFWWLATTIFSLIFWRKADATSWRNVGRRLFPTPVMPLLMSIYTLLIMVFIFDPPDRFLLQYYSPYGTFWIGAGAFCFYPRFLAKGLEESEE
jgi:hypothetical protein